MREVDSIEGFVDWVATGAVGPVAVQALDLRKHTGLLCDLKAHGSLFLGCEMDLMAAGHLVTGGAIVVPELPGAYAVHRARLYRAEELYSGYDPDHPETFEQCLDTRIYEQFLAEGGEGACSMKVTFHRALHDHSITEALTDVLRGHRVVAVMGGHGLERSSPRYGEIVRLAKRLAEQSYVLVSGGGPGAMEATHLGVWLSGRPDSVVQEVLDGPFTQRPADGEPGREYLDPDWLARAWRVREQWPKQSKALCVGIPTWLYGHEPPTPFATYIAKYFANSVREDGVLGIAGHGIVFARGSAGTTQEIFQDACQNHYGTMGSRSPMILLDQHYWTHTRPVWPLLRAVSKDEIYGELVVLVNSGDEAVHHIQQYEPSWYVVSLDEFETLESNLRRLLRLRSNWVFTHTSADPPDAAPEAEPGRALADWLFALGDDNWFAYARAVEVGEELLTDARVWKDPRGLVVQLGERVILWMARLDD